MIIDDLITCKSTKLLNNKTVTENWSIELTALYIHTVYWLVADHFVRNIIDLYILHFQDSLKSKESVNIANQMSGSAEDYTNDVMLFCNLI